MIQSLVMFTKSSTPLICKDYHVKIVMLKFCQMTGNAFTSLLLICKNNINSNLPPNANGIYISPIAFNLRMDFGISVNFAGGGK